MNQFSLTLIIPTLGRREKLRELLASISMQRVRPIDVIIVNGGDVSLEHLVKEYADLSVRCIESRPPSLTRQRNAGIAAIFPEHSFVGFLDDDIVLEENALEAMADFWGKAGEDVGGASFNIISDSFSKATPFELLFQVNSRESGRLLASGFNSKICSIEKTKEVDWLLGGATVWRKTVIDLYKFDEWFAGYAHCEDVEFSYRVSKKFRLMVVKEARVLHNSHPDAALDREYGLGKMHAVNRIHFVSLNPDLSLFLCYWACFGLFLNNIAKGMARFDRRYFRRAHGNAAGMIASLTGTSRSMNDITKPSA